MTSFLRRGWMEMGVPVSIRRSVTLSVDCVGLWFCLPAYLFCLHPPPLQSLTPPMGGTVTCPKKHRQH